MRYRTLGSTEIRVSEIGFGCMSLTRDHAQNERLLHRAFELGVTFFDTADLYDQGENEQSVGRALRDRRDQVVIASKVGNQWRPDGSGWDWNPSGAYIRQAIHATLRRLETDYLDLYQLHGGTIKDPVDETVATFEDLKAEGLIRAYGISSIRPNTIRLWLDRSRLGSVMTQYSLLDRRPEEEILDRLYDQNVGVIVRGAVAKGLLADKPPKDYLSHSPLDVAAARAKLDDLTQGLYTPAQLALRYALAHPAVATVAAGASQLDQVEENTQAGSLPPLTTEQLVALQSLAPAYGYKKHR
jgi:aryl-alcohol dehydrogenase-like predicted oxidoreductase